MTELVELMVEELVVEELVLDELVVEAPPLRSTRILLIVVT